jgi:hypothetical protein
LAELKHFSYDALACEGRVGMDLKTENATHRFAAVRDRILPRAHPTQGDSVDRLEM